MKSFLLLALTVLSSVQLLFAQHWATLNPHDDLFNNTLFSVVADKSGKVYAAGRSTDSADGSYYVAVLNNGNWTEVGGAHPLKGTGIIYALTVDSSGNLYAGGAFTDASGHYYVAKWDGTQWSELGGSTAGAHLNGQVFCMATDKAGNVYAAGELQDSTGSYCVGMWNGQSWAPLGTGTHALHPNGILYAVLPDGAGNVYAAGQFTNSGGKYYVAKWNGTDWVEAGSGAGALSGDSYIASLAKDGRGNIYAAGDFKDATGHQYVAQWDGSNWTEVGTGAAALAANSTILSIVVDNAGRIDAAGWMTDALGAYSIWQWTGSGWAEVPASVGVWPVNGHISSLALDNAGSLYAGGDFTDVNGDRFVAKLLGGTWSEPGRYGNKLPVASNPMKSLAVDTGGRVFAILGNSDPSGAQMIERWDGTAWNAVPNGYPATITAVMPDSLGNIYGIGSFPDGYGVAKWNGSGWTELPLPPGQQNYYSITHLATDKKGNVYISGGYDGNGGGVTIEKWNGSSWTQYGYAANIYNFVVDTAGVVYAAWSDFGWDTYNVVRIAPDGTQTSLGGGRGKYMLNANTWVQALAFDRAGNLYAGGSFQDSVGNAYIAKWDGHTWTPIPASSTAPGYGGGTITGICFDDGGNLYATSRLSGSSGVLAGKWDGHSWTSLSNDPPLWMKLGLYPLMRDNRGTLFTSDGVSVYAYDPPAPAVVHCDSVLTAGLVASVDTVTAGGGSVVLTASVTAGRGTGVRFLFARDRAFQQTLGPVSADSVVSVNVSDLSMGSNTFYVRVQATNVCANVLTAVDSVLIYKRSVKDTTSSGGVKLGGGPNPFGSSFTVTGLDAGRAYQILLVNSQGAWVYAVQVSGQRQVPIEGLVLKQGIYWLEVYDKSTGKRVSRLELMKMP